MPGEANTPFKKIDILLDMDGVVVAQTHIQNNLHPCSEDVLLPTGWRNYKKNQTVTIVYQGKNLTFLLLPGLLDMLQFFLTGLRDFVRVSFFSAGPQARNIELAEIIKNNLAANLKVHPDTIHFDVYSLEHCVMVPQDSELQPDSSNNPHIPDGCNFWRSAGVYPKKILRRIFGNDISNVILVDNSCCVMTKDETDHQLIVPTFTGFSGSDFMKHQATGMSTGEQFDRNDDFLDEEQFYAVNLACLITAVVAELIPAMQKLNISASEALKLLQICTETNKYKPALCHNPMYERYGLEFYYNGYFILSKIRARTLYSPYPLHAFDALQSLCNSLNYFIKHTLTHVTADYWHPKIYNIISDYHGKDLYEEPQPQEISLSQNTYADSSAQTDQFISDNMKREETNKKYPMASTDALVSKKGLFSATAANSANVLLTMDQLKLNKAQHETGQHMML